MNIQKLKVYVTSLLLFLAIDAVWLGFLAKDLYSDYLSHLLSSEVNWFAASLFYLIFIFGLNYFVISHSLAKKSLSFAIKSGALFGFVTYATYDLTNHATLTDWPAIVTILDLCWGAFICGSVSYLTTKIFSPACCKH